LNAGEKRFRLFMSVVGVVDMKSKTRNIERDAVSLPSLRFEISEAARILRVSRAQLYNRIHEGSIRRQKDGARTYITCAELERYVESCNQGAR
jgi:excisionase family DNA binding protein